MLLKLVSTVTFLVLSVKVESYLSSSLLELLCLLIQPSSWTNLVGLEAVG